MKWRVIAEILLGWVVLAEFSYRHDAEEFYRGKLHKFFRIKLEAI